MLVIRQWGGLGNQMFIYAFSRAQQSLGKDVKTDLSFFKKFVTHNGGYRIPEVFAYSNTIYASEEESSKLAFYQYDLIHRSLRKIGINKNTYISQTKRYKDAGYVAELESFDNAYLEGYFQSEKYFKSVEPVIRHEFSFDIAQNDVAPYIGLIKSNNSVSVHVRRGDYLNSKGGKLLFETDYYRKAIHLICENDSDAKFFIFSDDIPWCKEYFKDLIPDAVYVEKMAEAYYDMYLMTQCKANIIADSSFSWWGAWLNDKPDKVVLCPDKWPCAGSPFAMTDIVPGEWIKISVN